MSEPFKHSDEVTTALGKLKEVNYSLLTHDESRKSLSRLLKSFANNGTYKYPLWENLSDWESVRYEYAWEWFVDLLKDKKVVLFFEPDDDWRVFRFDNGADLVDVFNNCYGFVFYVANEDMNFLLCFNDHDYLISCGESKKWIRNLEIVRRERLTINTSPTGPHML